jgi:CHAP domain
MSQQADQVVIIATKEVGFKEGVNNETKYGKWFGMDNVPWCMEFVQWVLHQAGYTQALKTAGCEEFEAWAHRSQLIVPVTTVQKGDIMLYDFSRSGKSEHTGFAIANGINPHTHLIDTVEGNTSADNAKSQANGDGVYLKHRAPTTVRAVVRLKWDH